MGKGNQKKGTSA